MEHLPSLGHPDTPGRLRALLDGLEGETGPWRIDRVHQPLPESDTLDIARWLHEADYLQRFRATVAAAPGHLDGPDNPVSEGSFRSAVTAAGLATQAALDIANGRLDRAFLATRPAGHHAMPHRAMGFCFINNVALAAELVLRAWQTPLLIVDFDVHHGNGTQTVFYEREDVGYLSVHQHPFFPGTGTADETGAGRGLGATRNIPLAQGADDDTFASAFEAGLEELGNRLKPSLIVVSAGFDGHRDDPVGGMDLTEAGFERMGRAIAQASEAFSGGRILSVLEGGYHPGALARSVAAYLRAVAGNSGGATIN